MKNILALPRTWWRSLGAMTLITAIVALLVAACLAVSAAFGWQLYRQHRTSASRSAAIAAAKRTATAMMSVSYTTVDSDMRQVLDGATGDFAQQYKSSEGTVRSAVTENKVQSTAGVLYASLSTLDVGKTATVYLAVDATVKNTKAPKGTKSHYRMQVTVADKSGHWLVSKIVYVG